MLNKTIRYIRRLLVGPSLSRAPSRVAHLLFARITYERYWKKHSMKNWSYGTQVVDHLTSNLTFDSCLDAGCGQADVVRILDDEGYQVQGIELSTTVLQTKASDLLEKGLVQPGSLTELPFKDNQFDVVFSSDVLEHIPEKNIDRAISELVRVAKHHLFLTISLRPSSNNNAYHVTLHPRDWWEQKFLGAGVSINYALVNKLQKKKPGASMDEIMRTGPTSNILNELEWFINNPPYDLKGEFEPWYFIFNKSEIN